jgi:hypothetical protein
MTENHPITPSPEQVDQWFDDAIRLNSTPKYYIATQAAQWGADQELETILEMVGVGQQSLPEEDRYLDGFTVASIRAARRPKPPSRKEQALEAIGRLCASVIHDDLKNDAATIRRALEALDD